MAQCVWEWGEWNGQGSSFLALVCFVWLSVERAKKTRYNLENGQKLVLVVDESEGGGLLYLKENVRNKREKIQRVRNAFDFCWVPSCRGMPNTLMEIHRSFRRFTGNCPRVYFCPFMSIRVPLSLHEDDDDARPPVSARRFISSSMSKCNSTGLNKSLLLHLISFVVCHFTPLRRFE